MKKVSVLRNEGLGKLNRVILIIIVIGFILVTLAGMAVANSETEVNIKDYGAEGDGTTNDAAAFQNAIEYAYANNIISVHVPAGNYLIGHTVYVPSNISLLGEENSEAVLLQGTTANYYMFRSYTGPANQSNIAFKNLIVDGNGVIGGSEDGKDRGAAGLAFFESNYITLVNVTFRGFYATVLTSNNQEQQHASFGALSFSACEEINIEKCHFDHEGYYAIGFAGSVKKLIVKDSTFKNMKNHAVVVMGSNPWPQWYGNWSEDINLDNNSVNNVGGSRYYWSGAFHIEVINGLRITNNTFYNCGKFNEGHPHLPEHDHGSAIQVKQAENVLIDNNAITVDGTGSYDAIRTAPTYTSDCLHVTGYDRDKHKSDNITITNNRIHVVNGGRISNRGIGNRFGGQNIIIDSNTIMVDKDSYVKRAYFLAGNNITLTNNTLLNSGTVLTFIYEEVSNDTYGLGHVTNVTAENNAMALSSGPAYELNPDRTLVNYKLQVEVGDGGSITPVPGNYKHEDGSVVEILATPEEGWLFTGWVGDVADTSVANTTVIVDMDKEVTALFTEVSEPEPEPLKYTLQLSQTGSGTLAPLAGSHLVEAGTVVEISATPEEGWLFTGWDGDVADTSVANTTVIVDMDKEVTALFTVVSEPEPEPVVFTLKTSVDGSGSVDPATGSHEFEEGTVVNLTATPAAGWRFKEWKGEVEDTTALQTTVLLDGEKDVRAEFEAIGPAAPTLRAPADGAIVVGKAITFSWNKASGANRYQLELVNAANDSVYRTVTLKNVASYKMTKMPNNGSEFKWRVRSGNSLAWGEWSEQRTLVNNALPTAPTLRLPAADTIVVGKRISFSWYKASWANKYEIEVLNAADDSIFRTVALKNVTSYKMGKFLNNGNAYKWRVRGGNNMGWGEWSEYRTFTNNAIPSAPLLSSPVDGARLTGKTITFRWSTAARAAGYQLEIVRAEDGQAFATVNLSKGTSRKQSGFRSDSTDYLWRVRARNTVGFGPWSDYRAFTN